MSKRDKLLKYENLKKQLEVIVLYREDFENKLGVNGVEKLINDILDEMIILRTEI